MEVAINCWEFLNYRIMQDMMFIIQKIVLDYRMIEKAQVVCESKTGSNIPIQCRKQILAKEKHPSSIGIEPDRRQLLTMDNKSKEVFKIASYCLHKALGIYTVSLIVFGKYQAVVERFQYFLEWFITVHQDTEMIPEMDRYTYPRSIMIDRPNDLALVKVGKENKAKFVVHRFIVFTFEYTYYFIKQRLKYFLSVVKQPNHHLEKILMILHWYHGDNSNYYQRIHKDFHREACAAASDKNMLEQVDLERTICRTQESTTAFEKAHVYTQNHQSEVMMTHQNDTECLSNLKMYFVLLRSFDGKTNVFNDIVSLLPKFKKMGINTLWLSPPQPQVAVGPPMFAQNDHGYWPSHHGEIDPALGGEIAFQHLVHEAHRQGIEIAIDAVLNHFGYGDQVVINGKEISTSDSNYFVVFPKIESTYDRHRELNSKIEEALDTVKVLQYREELSQYPLFDLPTLRKDNSEVRTYLLDCYKKFIDMKVTTFRIDAAKHMPAEFLVDFCNQLNEYSMTRLGRPLKLIWEVYITNSRALSAFIEGTLLSLEDPSSTFFYDFPMREEFKRIQDPNYQFRWLADFVQFRESTRHRLDRLVPLVEDHDNGSPIYNISMIRMIYALTEFYSRNSTFIFHGSEQAGFRTVDRPRINTINESGDIASLVDRLGNRLSPYRIRQDIQTLFHVTEPDLLISEKRLPDKRSMLLAMNKSSVSRVFELPLQDLPGGDQMSVEKVMEFLDSETELDVLSEKIRVRLSPHSFLIIEVCSQS